MAHLDVTTRQALVLSDLPDYGLPELPVSAHRLHPGIRPVGDVGQAHALADYMVSLFRIGQRNAESLR